MNLDFAYRMSGETDEYLLNYINNRQKYVAEAIRAAVAELQKRGHVFEEAELQQIERDIALKEKAEQEENQIDNATVSAYPADGDLFAREPAYYSQQAILGFAVFFGTFFGSILMAINLKESKAKAAVVLIFGFTYAITTLVCVRSIFNSTTGVSMLFNILGGVLLSQVLWTKFIGKNVEYRKKPIWTPLIIGVVIFILLILLSLVPRL